MSNNIDSDALPLDGDPEFTPEERLALRRIMRDQARAGWALRQLRWLAPALVGFVVGFYHLIDWLTKHYKP